MIVFRKPLIDAPTTTERLFQVKKALDTLIDELNIAMEQIETPKMELDKNGVLHIS